MSTTRKILLYILYFIIVVALGVGIILAFTHHSTPVKPAPNKPGNSKTVTEKPTSPSTPAPQNSPATPPTAPTPSSTSASDAARNAIDSARGSSTSPQLANTGPGSTVAVFIASTLIGMVAYRRYLLRRIA